MNNKSENSIAVELGEQLRLAREALHLSLQACAQTTKIPQQVLSALEIGDYRNIPDGPYLGNYLRSYGSCLQLDGDVLEQFIKQVASGRNARLCAINTNVPETRPKVSRRSRKNGPVLTIALLLVIIGPLAWFATQSSKRAPSEPVPLEAVEPTTDAGSDALLEDPVDPTASDWQSITTANNTDAAGDGLRDGGLFQGLLTDSAQKPSVFTADGIRIDGDAATVLSATQGSSRDMIAQISTAAGSNEQGEIGSTNADTADAADDTSATAANSDSDASELILQLAADSWVEITTQAGERLAYTVLAGGDDYRFPATQNLRVTLGNAAAVTVLVNGEQADTQPYTRNSVARFRIVNDDDKIVLTGR